MSVTLPACLGLRQVSQTFRQEIEAHKFTTLTLQGDGCSCMRLWYKLLGGCSGTDVRKLLARDVFTLLACEKEETGDNAHRVRSSTHQCTLKGKGDSSKLKSDMPRFHKKINYEGSECTQWVGASRKQHHLQP